MKHTLPALPIALALLVSLPAAGAQSVGRAVLGHDPVEQQTREIASPFLRTADTGARGFASLAFGPEAYAELDELHHTSTLVKIVGFPIPGDAVVDLLLRPIDVMEPGATATVIAADGTRSALEPSVRLFSGSVPGRASRAFIGISKDMLHGYLSLDGEMHVLSSGPSGSGDGAAITHGDFFTDEQSENFCRTLGDAGGAGAHAVEPDAAGKFQVEQTKVFLELDDQYRGLFSTDQEAIDYAVLLTAATSEVYRRDLGVTLIIPNGYVQVWNETPPWGQLSTFGDIGAFSSYWKSNANPNKNLPRAIAHALTTPVFGGVAASIGGVCNKVTGYAISSVYGNFPYPIQHTSGSNWDLFVFAHENGHVYGSRHTFDYLPPIKCNDGSGPDNGTIMSYCHQSFGVGGVGMRFHVRVQDTIRSHLGTTGCQQIIQLTRGDYTMDGLVNGADVAELDAYVAQGFVSRGAQRAFDFDNNNVVDNFDRDLLLMLIQGGIAPASTTFRNGNGTNCPWCFIEVTPPLIGTTWSTYVGSYVGDPVLTMVVGATAPLNPGVMTPYGELLIGMTGFGGVTVFQNLVMTNGQFAQHDIPIPQMASLTGLTLYTQGAIFWPLPSPPLTNALDLFLAPF